MHLPYRRPELRRIGTLRELTRVGTGQNFDGMSVIGDPNGACDLPCPGGNARS